MCSIILETDANSIASKVATHSIDSGAPLSEQVRSSLIPKIMPLEFRVTGIGVQFISYLLKLLTLVYSPSADYKPSTGNCARTSY